MAAGTFAAPGTQYGPCEPPCHHTDCVVNRQMAEGECRMCGKPIGYDTRIYKDPILTDRFVHAACLEDAHG